MYYELMFTKVFHSGFKDQLTKTYYEFRNTFNFWEEKKNFLCKRPLS